MSRFERSDIRTWNRLKRPGFREPERGKKTSKNGTKTEAARERSDNDGERETITPSARERHRTRRNGKIPQSNVGSSLNAVRQFARHFSVILV